MKQMKNLSKSTKKLSVMENFNLHKLSEFDLKSFDFDKIDKAI
jgi:hypothetical protein